MSFTYGGTTTETLAGVTATLNQWPSLGGLTVQNQGIPGFDGRVFAGSNMERTAFSFDVIVEGSTVQEVSQRRDNLMGLLDPSRGPRDLILETDSAWKWPDVLVAQEILWERFTWERGLGFRLRADVVFETQVGSQAVETTPQVVTFSSSTTFTLSRGNTHSVPMIEFPGGPSTATVTIGSFSVSVGPTVAGQVQVLDWVNMEFYRRTTAGVRTGSLVNLMAHYGRPVLQPGSPVMVSVVGAGTGTRRLFPNARRI